MNVGKKLSALPGIKFHTSANPQLNNGLLAFTLPGLKNADIVETLKKRHRIRRRHSLRRRSLYATVTRYFALS